MKKFLAMVLSVTMAFSMLTGCNSNDNTGSESQPSSEPAVNSGTDSTVDSTIEEKELVSLRLIFYGDMTTRREEFFKNDFHDKVLEDLSIDLTVETMPWGSDTNIATMLASGENFAVYNIVSAFDWPSKGYLAEIDENLIKEHCPNLIRVRGENNGFDCVKYDDKIYAIPFGSKPYAGRMQSFAARNDILNDVGYDASDIDTYDELMEAIAAVKEKYPDLRVNRSSGFLASALNSEISEQLYVNEGTYFAYVDELEKGDKVYSWFESDAFKNACKITGEWADLGYIQIDEITNATQGAADWEAGNCLLMYGVPNILIKNTLDNVPEADLQLINIGDMPLLKTRDYDWGLSISASDQDVVDRWLDLFDWMYKDQDSFNFCVYGAEGKDWEYNEDGSISKLVTDSFFDNWFLEAMPYANYDSSVSEEVINAYMTYDDGSILSKRSGFSFDATPVSSELAMLTAVWTEKLEPMSYGLLDFEENYEKALDKLKMAGLDTYMEEYQRQFSEWYAKNH